MYITSKYIFITKTCNDGKNLSITPEYKQIVLHVLEIVQFADLAGEITLRTCITNT